jgi:HPt (histidine-containing phosphotransfer) domain-containing protein
MEFERSPMPVGSPAGQDRSESGPRASDGSSSWPIEQASDAVGDRAGDGVGTLEKDVGSEAYQQLLGTFLGHLSQQLVDLKDAAAVGDVAAARYVAHQINGTAPSFGAVRLDELADRVLQVGRDQGDFLPSLVEEIEMEVGQLQAVLSWPAELRYGARN